MSCLSLSIRQIVERLQMVRWDHHNGPCPNGYMEIDHPEYGKCLYEKVEYDSWNRTREELGRTW